MVHSDVVRADRINILPAPEPRRLQDAVDVVESEVDLAADIIGVDLAADRPTALPGALHSVTEDDGLGEVADVAKFLASPPVVVVLQGGHI